VSFLSFFSSPSYLSTSVQRGQGMLNRVAPGPFAVSARVQKTCSPSYNEYTPVFPKQCEENYINENDDSTDLSSQSSSEMKSPTTTKTTSINHENNKEVLSSTEQGTKITKTVVFILLSLIFICLIFHFYLVVLQYIIISCDDLL